MVLAHMILVRDQGGNQVPSFRTTARIEKTMKRALQVCIVVLLGVITAAIIVGGSIAMNP